MKRTYRGPIIEQPIEWGLVVENGKTFTDEDFALAVDDGTGEMVLIYVSSPSFVSRFNPRTHFLLYRPWTVTP